MTKKLKKYSTAPLPFMGQKRRFIKTLEAIIINCEKDTVYVDLFGGSGLLSHSIKTFNPLARVIYNDFDNYKQRLDNIQNTNLILKDIRVIVSDFPADKKMSEDLKASILKRISLEKGYVDYITLSSSLLFGMNYSLSFDELKKQTFYNSVRSTDYNCDGYLDGVITVSKDYKELFQEYKNYPNVIFVVDPPYLSTETKVYSNYWKLKDYLDVLNVLDGYKYLYFTSNKSNIIELCDWIETRTLKSNPFQNAVMHTTNNTMTSTASYTDIMMYKIV